MPDEINLTPAFDSMEAKLPHRFDGIFAEYIFSVLKDRYNPEEGNEQINAIIRSISATYNFNEEEERTARGYSYTLPYTSLLSNHIAIFPGRDPRSVFYSFLFKHYRGRIVRRSTQLYFYAENQWKVLNEQDAVELFAAFVQIAINMENEDKIWKLTLGQYKEWAGQLYKFLVSKAPEPLSCELWGKRFENGILRYDNKQLVPHSPSLHDLGTKPLPPYFFNTTLPKFLQFINSSFPNQQEIVQEVLGYLLFGKGNELQKLFFIYGVSGSGKSVLSEFIVELVGRANTTSLSATSFENNNGLGNIIDKQVALCREMRLDRYSARDSITSTILSITGQDELNISRKYKDDWVGLVDTKLVFVSNIQPNLGDTASALSRRTIYLEAPNSFVGRENHNLLNELKEEINGVIDWALVGYERLTRNNGVFSTSEAHERLLEEQRRLNNPCLLFAEEMLIEDVNSFIPAKELYNEYKKWAEENNLPQYTSTYFGRNLPYKATTKRTENGIIKACQGIRMKPTNYTFGETA